MIEKKPMFYMFDNVTVWFFSDAFLEENVIWAM